MLLPPLGSIGPWERVEGSLKLKKMGVVSLRLAKGFLQGGPKNSEKNRIFDHLQTLRISATVKNRGIQAAYVAFFCAP